MIKMNLARVQLVALNEMLIRGSPNNCSYSWGIASVAVRWTKCFAHLFGLPPRIRDQPAFKKWNGNASFVPAMKPERKKHTESRKLWHVKCGLRTNAFKWITHSTVSIICFWAMSIFLRLEPFTRQSHLHDIFFCNWRRFYLPSIGFIIAKDYRFNNHDSSLLDRLEKKNKKNSGK